MPTIRDTIRAVLGGDQLVTALVADRIYPGEVPDHDTPAPFVYYVVTEQLTTDEHEATDHHAATVELDVFAQSYEDALNLRTAVRSVLYCYAGGQVDSCVYRSAAEEVVEGGYRVTLTFGVRGIDASIVYDSPDRDRLTVADGGLYLGEQLVLRAAPTLIEADTTGQAAAAAVVAALVTQGFLTTTPGADVAASIPRIEVREDGLYFGDRVVIPDTPPALTYSRSAAGETAAVAAIRAALAAQGLVLDNTTA